MRLALTVLAAGTLALAAPVPESLRSSLTLHASFDKGLDADFARGDKAIYSAPNYKEQGSARRGAGDVDVAIEQGAGVGGGSALRFKSKNTRALFFQGDRHVALSGGTISFWLRVDPEKELAPGYTDPIQITDKAYNDSAIWVDFTRDERPRQFRLGVFGSVKDWNPKNLEPDKNPDFLRRLVVVERPPFSTDRWTHVAVTWSGLGENSASAALFLDGKRMGNATGIREPFQWDAGKLAIRLGVSYNGLMDEVAVFDRALSESEVGALLRAGAAK